MGEVVSSEGTVGVPGLMPALLPRNYFLHNLFSCSDEVWGFRGASLIPAHMIPDHHITFISLLKGRKKTQAIR